MPLTTRTQSWIKFFRDQIRDLTEGQFTVLDSRGKMRLQYRVTGEKAQSLMLPYDFSKSETTKALKRIGEIYKRFYNSKGKKTLAQAAAITEASSSQHKLSWDELMDEYRKFVPNASDKTWKKSYVPVLTKAGLLMQRTKGKPIDGESLMLKSLEQWEQGTRGRQIARRSLKNFLNWAVLRGKIPAAYAPPATVPEIRKPKRIGFALSDVQILRLIESETDEKWRFGLQLLSVYGLPPEELRFLRFKGNELWSIYQKSKGGTKGDKTEPRRLHPLLLTNMDGEIIDWKLEKRLKAGESLPPLGQEGKGSEALRTRLRGKPVWKALQKEAEHIGEFLVPYTFRHRYAKASHASGFPVSNIAAAMGHSIEVHLESYARFVPDGTADLYAKRNKTVKAA